LSEGAAWALGRLDVAAAIVGATLHAIDGSLNAAALTGLSRAWEGAAEGERRRYSRTVSFCFASSMPLGRESSLCFTACRLFLSGWRWR
jgi:hypothetical protein